MNARSIKPLTWLLAGLMIATTLVGFDANRQNNLYLYVAVNLIQALIYAAAVILLLTGRFHRAAASNSALQLILGLALLLRMGLLFSPPVSTDLYRYIWDGKVQMAGINPYRFVPDDAALAALRDDTVYSRINRADYAHTIYPPAAQLIFLASALLGHSVLVMKSVMLALECVAVACMLGLLKRRGLAQTRILLYVWNPLPLWEFSGSGHVDAAALAALWLAFLLAEGRSSWSAGIALGVGTLVKYYPALVGPAIWRRWDWKLPLAFGMTLAILYLPYASVGRAVLGFLPGYVHEEGLTSGQGFFLWALLGRLIPLPPSDALYLASCAALLIGAALLVAFRKKPSKSAIGLAGATAIAFTVMLSPHQAWYFSWLVPFLCFNLSFASLYLSCAAVLLYVVGWDDLVSTLAIYAPFFALLLVDWYCSPTFSVLEKPKDVSHFPL